MFRFFSMVFLFLIGALMFRWHECRIETKVIARSNLAAFKVQADNVEALRIISKTEKVYSQVKKISVNYPPYTV